MTPYESKGAGAGDPKLAAPHGPETTEAAVVATSARLPHGRPLSLLLNVGHAIDHMLLLVFATAIGCSKISFSM